MQLNLSCERKLSEHATNATTVEHPNSVSYIILVQFNARNEHQDKQLPRSGRMEVDCQI